MKDVIVHSSVKSR